MVNNMDEKENDENNEYTTLRVRKATLKRLEELKIIESETIDSVLNRLIEYAPEVSIVIKPKEINNSKIKEVQ
ncbi:MAG: hypothetical protein QW745_08310 [Thermoplasmata archaeon]